MLYIITNGQAEASENQNIESKNSSSNIASQPKQINENYTGHKRK